MTRLKTALIIAIWLLWGTPALAEDVAMVVDATGRAVYENPAKAGQEVILMDFLAEGDKIKLEDQARLVINYFASGLREEITGPGRITVTRAGSEADNLVKVKVTKVETAPPAIKLSVEDTQHAGTVVIRSAGQTRVALMRPQDTAVRNIRPTFGWRAVPGAETYRIRITDNRERLVAEAVTRETFWNWEGGLKLGEEYWWSVVAQSQGRIVAKGEAGFRILGTKQLADVAGAEAAVARTYAKDSAEGLIVLAATLEKHELFEEAAEVVRELLRKHPKNRNLLIYLKKLDVSADEAKVRQ